MNKVTVQNLLLLGCIILSIHGGPRSAASISSGDLFVGVSPDDMNYYRGLSSSSSVKCKDGSKIFNKSQFNDDFCDCPDGSDEPGTSACPNGKFYCKNAGHAPVIVYSSRVNDGICDCCDGSDEYDGKTKCSNTCWEAGKAAREKLRKKIATFKEGVTIRQKEIEQAKLAMDKDEGELLKLKDEEKILKELVEKIKERKELIEKAEEKERLQKEKEEKERKEAEEANKKETKAEDNESTHNDIHNDVGTVDQPSQDSVEDHQKLVNEPELIDHSIKDGPPNDGVDDNENTEHQEKEVNFDDKAGIDTGKQNTEHQGIEANFDDTVSLGTENQDENIAGDIETLSREELGRRIASRWTGEKTEQREDDFDASIDKKHAFPDETPNDISEKNGYGSDDDEHKYDDEEDKDDDDEHKDDDDEHKDDDDEHKDVDDEHKYDDDEHKYNDDEHTYDDDDDESEDQIDSTSYDSSSSPKSKSDDEYDSSDGSSWLDKIQKKVKNIFQAVNVFQKPVNISEAAHIRKEYDEYSAKLSKIQSRISSLKRKLKQDFGPEKEFYSFYGQCFETKQNKYVYKVCPFKEATQVEDHSTTRLGSWEKFEDSYRALQFLNGDKCWNGPDRSLKVKLRCGLKNELADVDEPSRCEYVALLSTPALCLDTRLKELENKLEKLSNDQPQGHDEL